MKSVEFVLALHALFPCHLNLFDQALRLMVLLEESELKSELE